MSTFFQNPYKGFNPRICKRCDLTYLQSCAGSYVSIHASVKDATFRFLLLFLVVSFNPRICKRCDCTECLHDILYFSFNPRICKRCDIYLNDIPYVFYVSIHASVKDATYIKTGTEHLNWFQSTHL